MSCPVLVDTFRLWKEGVPMAQMLIQLTMKSLWLGQNTVRRTERESSDREKLEHPGQRGFGYDIRDLDMDCR